MSTKKTRFIKGIIIAPDAIALDSIEGEIKVDSADGKIKVYLKDDANPSAAREVLTNSQTQTITNKTINVDNNILSNIETDNLKSGVLNTSSTLASASDTQLPSALAVKTYVDNSVAGKDDASEIAYSNTTSGLSASTVQAAIDEVDGNVDNLVTLSGVALDATNLGSFTGNTIPDDQTNKQALQALETAHESHTGASTNVHGIGATASVVGTDTSQTLTNKTIEAATFTSTSSFVDPVYEDFVENTQSGSDITLTGLTAPVIVLTNSSLISISAIDPLDVASGGGVITLVNDTSNEITVKNQAPLANAQIITGTDDDIDLADGASLYLKYVFGTGWRIIGGTGSGNVVIKATAGEDLLERTPVYISIGAADSGRTTGYVYKLDASNDDRIEFVGFIKEAVLSGGTAKIVTSGVMKNFPGLAVGKSLYASPTVVGGYTALDPSDSSYNNKFIIKIATAISSSQILINPDLASSAYFNPEISNNSTIANNQTTAANITNLIFDGASNRGFVLDYTIYRKTDSVELSQIGRLRAVYKTVENTWLMSDDYSGENAGVTFSITSSGQIQYTSTNMSGTNYSGVFDYKVTNLFEVI